VVSRAMRLADSRASRVGSSSSQGFLEAQLASDLRRRIKHSLSFPTDVPSYANQAQISGSKIFAPIREILINPFDPSRLMLFKNLCSSVSICG